MRVKTVTGNCFVCNDYEKPVRVFENDPRDLICESCDAKYWRSSRSDIEWVPWENRTLRSVKAPEVKDPDVALRENIMKSVQERAS